MPNLISLSMPILLKVPKGAVKPESIMYIITTGTFMYTSILYRKPKNYLSNQLSWGNIPTKLDKKRTKIARTSQTELRKRGTRSQEDQKIKQRANERKARNEHKGSRPISTRNRISEWNSRDIGVDCEKAIKKSLHQVRTSFGICDRSRVVKSREKDRVNESVGQ